ncbi:MAG TPA: hypothetical protein VMB72_03345 [Acidimicrobiales bacterium]|nr:hypothetical protein [Acidimicrobiales bacterium]
MSVAFGVVFAVFVLLVLGVAVLSVRWSVRRDRAARAARSGTPDPVTGPGPGASPGDGAPGAPRRPGTRP